MRDLKNSGERDKTVLRMAAAILDAKAEVYRTIADQYRHEPDSERYWREKAMAAEETASALVNFDWN